MTHFKPRLPFALLTAGLLVLSACGGSTTEPDDHDDDDDHAEEVEGVVLSLSGQTLASYDHEDGAWTGELGVEPGEQTGRIAVQFVDHDGDAVELDEDFYLEVDVADESIAVFQQDAPGAFGGQLRGVAEGDTEITFSLAHGAVGSGHADFVTAPLHLSVGHGHDE